MTFVTLAATVAACGSDSETVYCGNEDRAILAEAECESNTDGSYIYVGNYPGNYYVGEILPKRETNTRVKSNNTEGRTKLGIPARGGFGGNGSTLAGSSGG